MVVRAVFGVIRVSEVRYFTCTRTTCDRTFVSLAAAAAAGVTSHAKIRNVWTVLAWNKRHVILQCERRINGKRAHIHVVNYHSRKGDAIDSKEDPHVNPDSGVGTALWSTGLAIDIQINWLFKFEMVIPSHVATDCKSRFFRSSHLRNLQWVVQTNRGDLKLAGGGDPAV